MPNTGLRKRTKKTHKFQKIVFVDRDGVINYDKLNGYITRWEDFRFIPKSLTALKILTKAGYKIIIVSNQAGVGDGVYSRTALTEITRKMRVRMKRLRIKIAGIYYCLHGRRSNCACRKPKPGLLKQAARDFRFNKKQTYFIGDKISDILAGKRFGIKTAFVLTGHGRTHRKKISHSSKPDLIGSNLYQLTLKLVSR